MFNSHKSLPLGFPLNSNKAMSGGAMIVNFVHTVKEKLNEALDVSETSGIIAEVSIADFVLWSCTYTVIVVLKTTYLLLYYTGGCLPRGCLPAKGCLPVGGVICPGDVWQTPTRGQNSRHTLVKTLPFRNFVCGR